MKWNPVLNVTQKLGIPRITLFILFVFVGGLAVAFGPNARSVEEPRLTDEGLIKQMKDLTQRVSELTQSQPPVGSVSAFSGIWTEQQDVPSGPLWLPCDGRALNTRDFPLLAKLLESVAGNNKDRFSLPDLRGEFIRGLSNMGTGLRNGTADQEPNRKLLEPQTDALKQHHHYVLNVFHMRGNAAAFLGNTNNGLIAGFPYGKKEDQSLQLQPDASGELLHKNKAGQNIDRRLAITSTEGEASETRPHNLGLTYIIRAR